MNFENITAQDNVTAAFLRILASSAPLGGSVRYPAFPRAHILQGEQGTGKLQLARLFAKALNCIGRGESPDPCNSCASCRTFDSGNHPDTFFVAPTKTVSLGVDDVRDQIVTPMGTQPFGYKYKVFIVDKAETLTPPAQNALLKTIEEPAEFGFFLFLTTKITAMLDTVLSRCVVHKLHNHNIIATGNDEDVQELTAKTAENIAQMDIIQIISLAPKLAAHKEKINDLLDTLYIKTKQHNGAYKALSAIPQAKEAISRNGNLQLNLEIMLLKLAGKVDI